MGIFRKFSNAVARFMYGRNGTDQLNIAILFSYLVLSLLFPLLARALDSRLLFSLGRLVLFLLLILFMFRTFSRNLAKRRAENQKLVNFLWRFKSNRQGAKARRADKDHKYFTCKNCKTICRVPVGKGNIEITCPKCGAKIHART